METVPCVLFEDDHILVVNKPPGLNTHASNPHASEGIYDWLRHREPRWASLSIIHRLDKETSGVLVFGKTKLANRSLTAQFEKRAVSKKYVFLTDRPGPPMPIVIRTSIVREGTRFVCKPLGSAAPDAETRFRRLGSAGPFELIEAEPLTGRTHQVRTHAAHAGFPVLGDTMYGGTAAPRLYLHSKQLVFYHPKTCAKLSFESAPDWETRPTFVLREAIIDTTQTDAFRVIHGASDGWPGWVVEKLGDYLLSQKSGHLTGAERDFLELISARFSSRGVYHQITDRRSQTGGEPSCAFSLVKGEPANNDELCIRENGVKYMLRLGTSCSIGLFLDQRDNRRRLLTNHVAANFTLFDRPLSEASVLNLFSYTCGFGVCAALAGARSTNVDLSRNYLEWGRLNYALNNLDHQQHEFLHGDAFDWLRRLGRKQRQFDLVIIDPPTFSTSKTSGTFSVEKDLPRLIVESVPLIREYGVLFVSCNAVGYDPMHFVRDVFEAVESAGAERIAFHYAPQPPDFPTTKAQPAHLKTIWMRIRRKRL